MKKHIRKLLLIGFLLFAVLGVGLFGAVPIFTQREPHRDNRARIELVEKQEEEDSEEAKT